MDLKELNLKGHFTAYLYNYTDTPSWNLILILMFFEEQILVPIFFLN